MTQKELLDSAETKVGELLVRLPQAVEGLSDHQLSIPAPGGVWSLGGIIDHMNISLEPYLRVVEPLLSGEGGGAEVAVKNTVWGKFLTRMAGPDGNAPAPAPTQPRPRPFDRSVVEEWLSLHERFLATIPRARTSDLMVRYPNPIVSVLRMNVVDMYTLFPAHGERHVGQIENRRAGVEGQMVDGS